MSEYIITIEDWFFKYAHERYTHFFGCPIEEIVRCRDCTHFMTWANGYSFCSAFSIGATGDPFPGEPDGFCAWGARREP